jgi:hypothetical protein
MKRSVPGALTRPAASASQVIKLSDFELSDQHGSIRSYRFPKAKVSVMTIADHKGSHQLPPWIQAIRDRYGDLIDIDGIADVSMIPKPFHSIFRRAFRKRLAYSVMLDWGGSVLNQFGYEKGVANIYVIDRKGVIVKRLSGPVQESAGRELFRKIDRATASPSPKCS